MKKIIVLEPNIANKIAAGEVVERPASVVKELVENSIDAGSDAITVEIRNGGIDYIRITDNGSGIPEEDVEKAFLRHATSKLSTADDLSHIETLGFRGEALASIAAVSKLSMRTRTQSGEYGTYILIEGGHKVINEPCGCPCGTTIEINELFFNVPARLKFLKSARSEAAMIGDYVLRLILANPNVAIKFINNGKTIYHSAGDGSLENALFCVYGAEIASRLFKVCYDDGYLRLSGYVGSESLARSTRDQQSFFVNHRYIKSPVVSMGVQRAFDTRIMHGKFPFFVLDMLISSYEIDVNVHPNKLSVRYKDEERIGFAITRAIRDALNATDLHEEETDFHDMETSADSIKPEEDNAKPEEDNAKLVEDNAKPATQEELYALFGNKKNEAFDHDGMKYVPESLINSKLCSGDRPTEFSRSPDKFPSSTALELSSGNLALRDSGGSSLPAFSYPISSHKASNHTFSGEREDIAVSDFGIPADIPVDIPVINASIADPLPTIERPEQIKLSSLPYTIIGTVFDTYIIVQQDDAIYYIDQHAAHERILYEKLISYELRFNSQLLLVPELIRLDPIEFSILSENIERFEELGFSIEITSDTTIRINAVPNILKGNSEGFISNAIAIIANNGSVKEIDLIRSDLIQAACKKAVKAGDRLEAAEIESILSAYTGDSIPLTCPHGRPVIIRVTKTELQKRFKRII